MGNPLRFETAASTQVTTMKSMIADLERIVQVLNIDICTAEEAARVFDRTSPNYPILAQTLIGRRDNLNSTIALLDRRLTDAGAS